MKLERSKAVRLRLELINGIFLAELFPPNRVVAGTPIRKEANMEQNSAGLEASAATKGFRYARHRPEQTLLYQPLSANISETLSLNNLL